MCKTLCMNIRHIICMPETKATIYVCKKSFREFTVSGKDFINIWLSTTSVHIKTPEASCYLMGKAFPSHHRSLLAHHHSLCRTTIGLSGNSMVIDFNI